MIHAFVKAGMAFDEDFYIEASEKAIQFIFKHLWAEGKLLRRYRDGAADYASMIRLFNRSQPFCFDALL